MPGLLDYVIGSVSFVLEICVVVFALYSRPYFRYTMPAIYMLFTAIVQTGAWISVERYGTSSPEYFNFYYYGDSMLAITLFFVIIQLYQWIFTEMSISRYIRSVASALLVVTAVFSYLVIHQNKNHLTTQFVVEFGQNIYFVGVVLTYLLWGAMLKLRETRTRVVQLVLALGIYFSAYAGVYALRNLFPSLENPILRWFPPLISTWLPLAWTYTFARVPETARQAPSQLLTTTPAPALAVKAS